MSSVNLLWRNLRALMRRTGLDSRDIIGAAGYASLVYGLALWWVPAAWIGGGALLLALALGSSLPRRRA